MGRSLRRHKKFKPKIIKRNTKKPQVKSKLPAEVSQGRTDIKKKLGTDVDWDKTEHTTTNYQNMGFASNPNAGFGRNKKPDLLQDKIPTADQLPLDTDLKLVLGQADTKGPPKRPASRQRTIIQRLIGTHGTDIEAMTKDRKLNTMQHTEAELKRLIYACSYWKEGSGVDFRVPRKSLWK